MCNYIFTLHTSTNISFLSVDPSSPTIFNQLYLLALSRKSLNCADWELQDKPFNLNSDKKKKKRGTMTERAGTCGRSEHMCG